LKKLLIIDNYDSFTYNLVQYVEQHGSWYFDVKKNDEMYLETAKSYDKILLSPGPGLPEEAGIMMELIETYKFIKPILGVCLGHHAIAVAFGAGLYNFVQPVHGIQKEMAILKQDTLFKNVDQETKVGLYHSWAVSMEHFPENLEKLAISKEGVLMAFRHRKYDVKGVQFHPESIMTDEGKKMIWNWLES
jgi:anthranilate synthase component 2